MRSSRVSTPLLGLEPKEPPHKGPLGTPVPASTDVGGNDKAKDPFRSNSPSDEMDLLGSSASNDALDLLESSPPKVEVGHVLSQPSSPRLSVLTKGATPNQRRVAEVVITTPRSFSQSPRNVGGLSTQSPSPSAKPRDIGTTSPLHSKQLKRNRSPYSFQAPNVFPALPHTPSPVSSRTSPSKQIHFFKALPRPLPPHLQPFLWVQKAKILKALREPPLFVEENESPSSSAFGQLNELLKGTVQRNEGNSCLILGPSGCGKSRLVDRVLESVPSTSAASPVILRLSAHYQTNDRLAMREIARQIQRQIEFGPSLPTPSSGDRGQEESVEVEDDGGSADLPPSSHLPLLVSALPALGRPIIVVLDAFDGFATHARQALLYCLLDTVQACCGGVPPAPSEHSNVNALTDTSAIQIEGGTSGLEDSQVERQREPELHENTPKGEHGLLVIGVTSRVDCLTLLEKRVKSRFSHRIIRVKPPSNLDSYLQLARGILCVDPGLLDEPYKEWRKLWLVSVENFLTDKSTLEILRETFALVKDIRMLCRLLTSPVIALTPSSPWLTSAQLLSSARVQRCPERFPFLSSLLYPHVSLLIAAVHIQASGHDTFNFEMLFDAFITQTRTSSAAPVQIPGNTLGMVKVPRGVMVGAFEHLVATRVFQPIAAPSSHVTREFVRYRCAAYRDEIKAAVDHLGQTNLKKWFYKAQ